MDWRSSWAGGALLAPEPTGATKVVGAVVLLHGVDTLQASVRTVISCDRTATLTQAGATSVAQFAGASPRTAETRGVVTDITVGVGGTFAVGTLSRVTAGAGRLVHLTSADSAASIRASETLGLGRSTIYAGPATLANARGWSIVQRTGLMPSQATEVILLPSAANRSFLVVQPMGVFSGWQRLNGAVFSAGSGVFNLATGAFTRTGAATNQLAIYGIDTAFMAAMRDGPFRHRKHAEAMRLERIVLSLAVLMLTGGYIAWALGGAEYVRSVSLWLWFAGFGVLSLPLAAWLVHRVIRRNRD